MSYILHHIKVVQKLVTDYKSSTPFAVFLKNYYSQHKQHGSKDRKSISHLCFTYFRIGNCIAKLDFQTRLKTAIYLCNNTVPENTTVLFAKDELNNWSEEIDDRILRISQLYPSFKIEDLLPFPASELSTGIDWNKFIKQYFNQPKLFARIRNPRNIKHLTQKLLSNNIDYTLINNNCLSFSNNTPIDRYLSINKEVVIQDYSSQQIASLFHFIEYKEQKLTIWDCCAASGGKSILMYDYFKDVSLTVSDIRESIIHNLKDRFKMAGISNYRSFTDDISIVNESNKTQYQLVVADTPCTGSGTWGRTPEYLSKFNMAQLESYTTKQQLILNNIVTNVANGGYLLYITCSALKKENEDMVNNLLLKHTDFTLIHQQIFEGYNLRADTMYAALLRRIQ